MIFSFALNFFFRKPCFYVRGKKSHREPDRANTMDVAAIRSAIRAFWPRRFWMNELVCCRGGRALFTLSNVAVPLSIVHRIGSIIHYNIAPWPCVLSPKSPWGLFPLNRLEKSIVLIVAWSLAYSNGPRFNQWWRLVAKNYCGFGLKRYKHCIEVNSRVALLKSVSNRGTYRADSFLIPNLLCKILIVIFIDSYSD